MCSFPGVGYATQVIVALLNVYYIVVLAWAIFFLSNSFTWDLPWASCNNYWNTGNAKAAATDNNGHSLVWSFLYVPLYVCMYVYKSV